MARHKENFAAKLINELGITVQDNASPSTVADPNQYGSLQGRDITGARNGSMTLNDIFDLYAWLVMRGFTPDTLIMHPLMQPAAPTSDGRWNNELNCREAPPGNTEGNLQPSSNGEGSETTILESERILNIPQTMEWSDLHGNMQNLAEMTRSLINID